jgi:DNA-binding NarL/FixJ family response regulator
MSAIRTAIIEDDQPFANALEKYFAMPLSGVECIAVYPTAEEALRLLPRNPPDVVLVDINLPKMSGIECIGHLKGQCPTLLFLILTSYDQNSAIFDALKAGASGYLLKRTPPAEIVSAIEQVRSGGSPMSPHIARQVVSYFHRNPVPGEQTSLTVRERDVIELLAAGAMYKEIADTLSITLETVRSHVKNIYDKLHAHSRTEAVRKYRGQS